MSPILQFLLVLAIMILAAKASGYLSTRLGQPAVLGELLAGLVLGPSLLNIYGWGFMSAADSASLATTFKKLSELGVIFLMFMAGLEINLKDMFKVGKVAVFSGTSGVIFPIVWGFLVALPFGYAGDKALFIGILLAATSVSISAQTLLELGVLRRKDGVALLGAAVLDDVLVVLILSLYLSLVIGGGGGVLEILFEIVKMLAFFVITILLGRTVLPWLMARIKKLPISEGLLAFTIALIALTAWTAEYLGGVAMIVGAFLLGVLIGQTYFKHELEEKFHAIMYSLFVPLFFVSVGLIIDLTSISSDAWIFAIVLCVVAIGSKIIGCGLGARLSGFDNRSSLRLGLGMVSRGEVGLIVASVGINEGIINQNVYAGAVVMVLVTTLFTPLALKWAFKGEKEALKSSAPATVDQG